MTSRKADDTLPSLAADGSSSRLTVLMPVKAYRARYLHEAAGSTLAQTCRDWRLVVIAERAGRGRLDCELPVDPRIELVVNEGRRLGGAFKRLRGHDPRGGWRYYR